MIKESWKDIPGYIGLYQASTFGRIKSLERYVKRGDILICRKERILKQFLSKKYKKYLCVKLYKDGLKKTFTVHRLVWLTFKGEIEDGLQINHINENPTDNRLENLNLMTPKENCNWGSHNKKISEALKGRNININKSPIEILQLTLDGVLVNEWSSMREAERNGYNHNGISACCRGVYKKSQGYIWRYKNGNILS